MFKRLIITSAIALALVSTTTNAHPAHMGQLKQVFKQLDLSEQQKQDIRGLMQQARSDRNLFRDDMQDLMQSMQSVIQAAEWDQTAALQTIQQRQSLLAQAGYQKALNKQALWQILDAEQQAEFDTLMADFEPSNRDKRRNPFKRLDLTSAQETQIESVKTQAKATAEELKPQLQAFKQAERNLIKSGELSEAAWQGLADEYAESFTQMALNKAYARHQVWNLLDAEQQQKAEKMMKKARKHAGKKFTGGPFSI